MPHECRVLSTDELQNIDLYKSKCFSTNALWFRGDLAQEAYQLPWLSGLLDRKLASIVENIWSCLANGPNHLRTNIRPDQDSEWVQCFAFHLFLKMFMNTPVFTLFFIMSSVFLSKNHLPFDRPTYHFPESLALFKLKLAQALTVNENLRKEHLIGNICQLKFLLPKSTSFGFGQASMMQTPNPVALERTIISS